MMTKLTMIQPVVILAAWTMVMWVWMISTRLPALRKAGVDLKTAVGGKGSDSDTVLPPRAGWPAHNYTHLLEQPTAFYAITLALAFMAVDDFPTRVAAWSYMTIRIVHSVWQATVNQVIPRFVLFAISSLLLVALCVRAGLAAWGVAVPL